MSSFRDIKRDARRVVHENMRVPALYIADPTKPHLTVPCMVRVHTRFGALGGMAGTNFHAAERHEALPQIIFWRDELPTPVRGALVSVEPGEAYRVDHVMPPDDQTITATVVILKASDTTALPTP